jgi:two-component sensor histidine kinase
VASLIPLPSALKERILLRELNRRINNDLATAIELVSASAVLADNQEVKAALSSVVELLHKYADVHRALTIPVSRVLVDAAEYLRRLGQAMTRSTLDRMKIRLVLAVDAQPLESDRCWQLGLIVHELVTNAAQHAHFKNGDGEIRVELRRAGALVTCDVSDNGSSSAAAKSGGGLGIAGGVAKILGGQIERDFGAGSRSFLVTFPTTKRERRANGAFAWRRRRAIQCGAPSALVGSNSGFAHSRQMRAS